MSLQSEVAEFAGRFYARAPQFAEAASELCAFGEWGIAFENLLSNLLDHDIETSVEEIGIAARLSTGLGLAALQVEALRGRELDESGRRRAVVLTLAHVRDSKQLHTTLAAALGFPDFYGKNWDAFWDAITGLVTMPWVVRFWGWPELEARLPTDASQLLAALSRAEREFPAWSAAVELYSADGAPL